MNSKQRERTMTKAFRLFLAAALLAVLLGIQPVPVVHAATFTVTKTADTNDGTCDGDCSLREAIAAANAAAGADTITLPAGTYTLTITGRLEEGNATGDLDITDDLTINGAGSGSTIIQAGTNATNGIDRVFHIPSPDGDGVTVTFNDMTIRYGYLPGNEDGKVDDGAAIHNETGATVNINNCIITQNTVAGGYNDAAIANQGLDGGGAININNCTISYNSSDDDGGGVFNKEQLGGTSTINITDTTISNNITVNKGGGVYNEDGTVTISNSTILTNTTTDSNYGDGGGVTNCYTGTLTVSNTTFSGNESADKGSAIYNEDPGSSLDVQNSVFDGNTATDDGTIACHDGATCTISTSTFSGNTANSTGGALYVSDSDTQATITTSTLTGNTADDGGGVYVSDGATITLTNVTISGNDASDDGGGIYTTDGPTLTVINSTIAGNQAGDDGGGLRVSSSGSHTLKNTIVDGNTAIGSGDNCEGAITNGGYNIDSDTTCGWGSNNGSMSSTDPLLDPLANNGGPTETRALLTGSPAIDTIPEGGTGYNGAPATDQRGVDRPQGGACDIGAYELEQADLTITKSVTPATAAPGDTITYTLAFSNTGTSTATGVVITDTIPISVTNTSVISSGAVITDTGVSPPYAWDVADLAVGTGGVITITGVLSDPLPGGHTFTNTATITTTAVESDAGNNSGAAGVTVSSVPVITVTKTANVTSAEVGETITYTYRVTNTGNVNLTGVVAHDDRLGAITLGSTSLAPDVGTSGTLTHTVVEGDLPSPLANTVTVTGTPPTGPAVTATADESVALFMSIRLPLVMKDFVYAPDLVVDSLVATSNAVTVTIKNQGNAAVTDEFWVDVYFNPNETPSLNHPWDAIASHGAVWGVTTTIQASGVLTLTTGGDYYVPEYSSAPPLPVGANVYALVDSVDYSTTYGAVQESNEGNNLSGPVTSTTATGQAAPVVDQGQPVSMEGLPPR